MRIPLFFILLCGCGWSSAEHFEAISVEGFADIVRHWQKQNDQFTYPSYTPEQITGIADNLLLYQRNNGGWPKNVDPMRILSEQERLQVLEDKTLTDTTLDNRNTYTQIEYLSHAYSRSKDRRYRKAAEAGLTFILDHQYDNGGWPHTPTRSDEYYGHITFTDDVMPGVLNLLRQIAERRGPFTYINDAMRKRVIAALAKGDQLLLQLQIRRGDGLTAWAGQYDRVTLAPAAARTFELPGLVSLESVSVVRYLMGIEKPSLQIINAVEGAVKWFAESSLQGIRVEKIAAKPVRFTYHSSNYDFKVVEDKNAPPVWARFYEIDTNKPFMANRDGKKVYRLSDVHRERRTGYAWYGYWPADLLEKEYPAWKKRIAGLDAR
jgi:PelA/Pel-15E family pectate lyase